MKIRVNEAESDYVKIGNMVLPKNAASYGYDDYDTIARKTKAKYNQEKEVERQAAEAKRQAEIAAKVKAKGAEQYDKFMEIYNANKDNELNTLMQALFDEFVPGSGSCDNLGAEFIRAMSRLRYRCYNDGDFFYKGYGLETAGPSAAFLADYGNEAIEDEIINMSSKEYDFSMINRYMDELKKLAYIVLEYLSESPELFGKPVVDSRDYDSDWINQWEEQSHCLEYEPDVSGEYLDRLLESGCIGDYEVRQFLEDLASKYGGDVYEWARDAYTITDLDEEEYELWEQYFEEEFRNWLEELMEEFEDEIYAYENGEDEDDWEDDED